MAKELKTNAMRLLDKNKIKYNLITYECDEFIDGITVANKTGVPQKRSFKTLVTVGKSNNYYVFVLPVAKEIDFKKAAKIVGEKSLEMIHVKDINKITGYIRGGCTPIGMKKQYHTVIDKSAKTYDTIFISGGRIGTTLELNPNDLTTLIAGEFGDFCQ